MERPVGVTVIAVLNFLGAFFLIIAALFFVVGFGAMGMASQRSGGMLALAGVGAFGAVFMFAFAVIAIVIGYGLIKLQHWARIVTIVLAALGILLALPSLFGGLHSIGMFSLLIRVGINALILWYMLQANVKQAFGAAW